MHIAYHGTSLHIIFATSIATCIDSHSPLASIEILLASHLASLASHVAPSTQEKIYYRIASGAEAQTSSAVQVTFNIQHPTKASYKVIPEQLTSNVE
jgi:hypothetical protein